MAKTATITLGGTQYTIKPFNLGELEHISEMQADKTKATKVPFEALRIVLRRAEPKCEKPDELEVTPEEMQGAFAAIMDLSGMKPPAKPGEGGQGAATAGEAPKP